MLLGCLSHNCVNQPGCSWFQFELDRFMLNFCQMLCWFVTSLIQDNNIQSKVKWRNGILAKLQLKGTWLGPTVLCIYNLVSMTLFSADFDQGCHCFEFGLCAACWANFVCHHELLPTSMSHCFSFLNSSLGVVGGKHCQKMLSLSLNLFSKSLLFYVAFLIFCAILILFIVFSLVGL